MRQQEKERERGRWRERRGACSRAWHTGMWGRTCSAGGIDDIPNRDAMSMSLTVYDWRSSVASPSTPPSRKLTCTSAYAVWPVFLSMWWRHRQTVNARSISVSAKTISLPTGDNKSGRGNVHNDACAFSNPSLLLCFFSLTRTGTGPYLCSTSAHITHSAVLGRGWETNIIDW